MGNKLQDKMQKMKIDAIFYSFLQTGYFLVNQCL